jgi:pyridoxal phosphate enzyme (YggS family)
MNSAQNYQVLTESIAEIAYKCGRNPADIEVVAATKGHPLRDIQPVYQFGCRDFGESWMQEALPKIAQGPEDIRWHFIGNLQKNKVRKALSSFALIHSVDSYELAAKISESSLEEEIVTKILLEVNTSGEETKHGFSLESVRTHLEKIISLPSIEVQGFMTMAPHVQDEYVIRSCFSKLWHLRDEIVMLAEGTIALPHLSMGMSNDYHWAIQEGATILRIGTAIFGDRE